MGFNFPNSPSVGTTWLAPNGTTYIWDGEAWRITNDPYASGVVISDTPPANPFHGMLWWESDSGNTFIYFDDGDSAQWVQFNLSGIQDRIASVSQDMSAFFTSASFVVNTEPDGSGTNVFMVTDSGFVTAANVKIELSNPILNLDRVGTSNYGGITGRTNGLLRWLIQMPGADAESGSNVGGGFYISRYSDAGSPLSTPFQIARNTGAIAQAPTRISDNGLGTPITWHTFAGASVIDYAGPGNDWGLMLSNRVANPGSPAIHFMWSSASSGTITVSNGSTAYNTTSDARTKDEVKDTENARALVDALRVVEYTPVSMARGLTVEGPVAVEGVEPGPTTYMGIPAQQAYSVFPTAVQPPDQMPGYRADAVVGDDDFMPWMIDYSKFVPMLIANMQEANKLIDELQARLAALEGAA